MSMKMNFQKRENFSDILDDHIMKIYLLCTLVSHQTQSLFRGNGMTEAGHSDSRSVSQLKNGWC